MPQVLTQTNRTEQRQQISGQQVLTAQLTELSVEELRTRIKNECLDNPYLEPKDKATDDDGYGTEYGDNEPDAQPTDHDTDPTTDDVDWGGNEFPTASTSEQKYRREDSEVLSFHDLLMQQIGEYDLDDHQRTLLEYLIGSLEDDGLLRTPLMQIADELDIKYGIRTNERELLGILKILQEFEPCGVGARNLCECLYIQVQRHEQLPMRSHLITLFKKFPNEFMQSHWDVIQRKMRLSDTDLSAMRRALQHLNPRPGGSVGKSPDEAAHMIVPDFRVQADEFGQLHFQLCEQDIPQLQLSEDLTNGISSSDVLDETKLHSEVEEGLRFLRGYIERGNIFIEALAQRRRSMILVMQAIMRLQEEYFLEGDENLLKPMRLEDVANITKLDISTVSRVCRSKTVMTDFGTRPLRWFFMGSTTKEGEEVTVRRILSALKELVDNEDKRQPLSDERLTELLRADGYDVARRTVAKYREQLGIANSRMRR